MGRAICGWVGVGALLLALAPRAHGAPQVPAGGGVYRRQGDEIVFKIFRQNAVSEITLRAGDAEDLQVGRPGVQRVRGEVTSNVTALKLMLTDDGAILAARDGPYVPVGILYVEKRDENEVIDAAIERIIRTSGIFKR